MFSNCQPRKLKYITNTLPLCPFVIRIESFKASVALTLGLLANMYDVIEYANPFITVGMNKENNPTRVHKYIHRSCQHMPPNLRPKLIFRFEYGSE